MRRKHRVMVYLSLLDNKFAHKYVKRVLDDIEIGMRAKKPLNGQFITAAWIFDVITMTRPLVTTFSAYRLVSHSGRNSAQYAILVVVDTYAHSDFSTIPTSTRTIYTRMIRVPCSGYTFVNRHHTNYEHSCITLLRHFRSIRSVPLCPVNFVSLTCVLRNQCPSDSVTFCSQMP